MISGVNENACLQSVSMKQIHLLMRRVSTMSTLTLRTSQVRLAVQAAFLLPVAILSHCVFLQRFNLYVWRTTLDFPAAGAVACPRFKQAFGICMHVYTLC